MRRPLGVLPVLPVLVLLAALTACGSDDSTPVATDPSPVPTSGTTTDDPSAPPQPTKAPPIDPSGVEFDLVTIVSATAAGGDPSSAAVLLDSQQAVDTFSAGFSRGLDTDIEKAATPLLTDTDAPDLYAAVVGSGCDVPTGVEVARTASGYAITGAKIADPTPECFAPVTSVALVEITG